MVGFPLLLIPLAVFNIIVFLMPGVSMTEALFGMSLPSGVHWPVTLGDLLLALSMLLLLLEVIKGARPGAKYLMDHLLSFVVFGAAAAEFVLWPKFGNSVFFLLTLLALVDFLGSLALRMRRGSLARVGAAPVPVRGDLAPAEQPNQPLAPTPPAAPAADHDPAAGFAPSAAAIAESVLSQQPAPHAAQAATPPPVSPPGPPLVVPGGGPATAGRLPG